MRFAAFTQRQHDGRDKSGGVLARAEQMKQPRPGEAEARAAFRHFLEAPREGGLRLAIRGGRSDGPRLRPGKGVIARFGRVFGAGANSHEAPRAGFRGIGGKRGGGFQPISILGRGPEAAMRDIPGGVDDDGGAEVLDQPMCFILAQQIHLMRCDTGGGGCGAARRDVGLVAACLQQRRDMPPDESRGARDQNAFRH